jgi:hypothetical protein
MSSRKPIVWTRDQRARAKAENKVLFAIGVDSGAGYLLVTDLCADRKLPWQIHNFWYSIQHEKLSPQQAFDKAFKTKEADPQ